MLKKLATTLSLVLLLSVPTVTAQRSRCRPVRFAPGRTTAVLRGSVRARTLYCYTLRASANQRMTAHVTSPRNNVRLTIERDVPYDTDPLEAGYGVANWEGDLPENGNYRIMVWVLRGTSTFTLEVGIR